MRRKEGVSPFEELMYYTIPLAQKTFGDLKTAMEKYLSRNRKREEKNPFDLSNILEDKIRFSPDLEGSKLTRSCPLYDSDKAFFYHVFDYKRFFGNLKIN